MKLLLIVVAFSLVKSGEGHVELFLGRHWKWGITGIPPRVNTTENLPSDSWFTQKLDHFDKNENSSWQQRYFVNDQYYESGGPVFLMIGGEAPISPNWMISAYWITPAKTHSALLFQLEHRFYGKSHPTIDMSTENLKYLTSEQALADLATFQRAMEKQYNLTDNKWIIFGCSYSGNLATWYRLYYPNLAHAVLAGSAPVLAEVNFFQYLEVVSASLESILEGCSSALYEAMEQVQTYMRNETAGQDYITKLFNICHPLHNLSEYDIYDFYFYLAETFSGMVQYYDTYKDNYCDMMVNGTGMPIERLAQVVELRYGGNCISPSYSNMIHYYQLTKWSIESDQPGGRPWLYQTCNEFGYYSTTTSKKQPFTGLPLEYFISQCVDVFGARFTESEVNKNIDHTNFLYKGKNLNVTRVAFPTGSLDPWRPLSVQKDLNPDSLAITIQGSSHCAVFYPEDLVDNPSLKAAQRKIDEMIDNCFDPKHCRGKSQQLSLLSPDCTTSLEATGPPHSGASAASHYSGRMKRSTSTTNCTKRQLGRDLPEEQWKTGHLVKQTMHYPCWDFKVKDMDIVSHSAMEKQMRKGLAAVKLSQIQSGDGEGAEVKSRGPWATLGTIVKMSNKKTTSLGKEFIKCYLSDLQDCFSTTPLYLCGEALRKYENLVKIGSAVFLFGIKIIQEPKVKGLLPEKACNMLLVGRSADLRFCRIRRPDGHRCSVIFNRSNSSACSEHDCQGMKRPRESAGQHNKGKLKKICQQEEEVEHAGRKPDQATISVEEDAKKHTEIDVIVLKATPKPEEKEFEQLLKLKCSRGPVPVWKRQHNHQSK